MYVCQYNGKMIEITPRTFNILKAFGEITGNLPIKLHRCGIIEPFIMQFCHK